MEVKLTFIIDNQDDSISQEAMAVIIGDFIKGINPNGLFQSLLIRDANGDHIGEAEIVG